jgi:predicted DNA-binding transcriptional regulator AlpA
VRADAGWRPSWGSPNTAPAPCSRRTEPKQTARRRRGEPPRQTRTGTRRHRCPHVQTALDDEDLSAYLSVPVATIYKWRTTGEAPRAHKIGRYLRWAPADVFDWLEGKRDAG